MALFLWVLHVYWHYISCFFSLRPLLPVWNITIFRSKENWFLLADCQDSSFFVSLHVNQQEPILTICVMFILILTHFNSRILFVLCRQQTGLRTWCTKVALLPRSSRTMATTLRRAKANAASSISTETRRVDPLSSPSIRNTSLSTLLCPSWNKNVNRPVNTFFRSKPEERRRNWRTLSMGKSTWSLRPRRKGWSS